MPVDAITSEDFGCEGMMRILRSMIKIAIPSSAAADRLLLILVFQYTIHGISPRIELTDFNVLRWTLYPLTLVSQL